MLLRGTVTFWHPTKEFGFIRRDDGGPDLFVHRRNVERFYEVDGLKVGDVVEFEPGISPKKKPCAEHVRLATPRGPEAGGRAPGAAA